MPGGRPSRENPWLTIEEQRRLLEAARQSGNQRDYAIITLLLYTGARPRELCDLTWQDIELREDGGTMNVKGSETTHRGGRVTLPRVIPLNVPVRQALYALGYEEHRGTTRPVLMGRIRPLATHGILILFGKHATTAGLPNIRPDNLRHSFCKNLADAGADLRSIAALAGHLTYETARQYFEGPPEGLEQLVDLPVEKLDPDSGSHRSGP